MCMFLDMDGQFITTCLGCIDKSCNTGIILGNLYYGLLVGKMGFALQDFGQAGVLVSVPNCLQGTLFFMASNTILYASSTKKSISIAIGLVVTLFLCLIHPCGVMDIHYQHWALLC